MEDNPLKTEKLNVLIYGKVGSREKALIEMLDNSPEVNKIHFFTTSADTRQMQKIISTEMPADFKETVRYCQQNKIDLVIVGPEAPLAEGLADVLRTAGIAVFGPGADAAKLEASKEWSNGFMLRHNIPTAKTTVHTSLPQALDKIRSQETWPVVVKYDGLMGGKGVTICYSPDEARVALEKLYNNEPNAVVLLQEYLPDNPAMVRSEVSVHVIVSSDGSCKILPTGQDYKPRFDRDKGPMTGGMGCFGPVPGVNMDRIETEIIKPTIEGLLQEKLDYRGVIYFGIKLCPDGPMVVEYNVRFGDPEMVTLSKLITSDLIPLLWTAAKGEDISKLEVEVFDGSAVSVVIVDKAYPTSGGRVDVFTKQGSTIAEARELVYAGITRSGITDSDYRKDIAASM